MLQEEEMGANWIRRRIQRCKGCIGAKAESHETSKDSNLILGTLRPSTSFSFRRMSVICHDFHLHHFKNGTQYLVSLSL